MTKKIGADLSHYNQVDWRIFNPDFVFCKCTQGTSYLDQTYKTNKSEVRKKGIPLGSYHFANGTNYAVEAQWYLDNADYQPGDLLALDYEIHLSDPVTWCKGFLNYIESRTGTKPFLYINLSTAKGYDWSPVDNPLWMAAYGINDGKEHDPKYPCAIHQFTSAGSMIGITGRVDLNSTEIDFNYIPQAVNIVPSTTLNPQPSQVTATSNPILTATTVLAPNLTPQDIPSVTSKDYQSYTDTKTQWQQLVVDIVALIKHIFHK